MPGYGPIVALISYTLIFACLRMVDIHLDIMQVRAVNPPWGWDGDKAVAEVDEGVDEVPV